jgi:penicillin-binding protein 1A
MSKKLIVTISIIALLGLISLATVGYVIWKVSQDLPPVEKLKNYTPPVPSSLYDRNGNLIMLLGNENRKLVPYNKIPKVIVDAVISAEDDQFFNHDGVDLLGVMRAMLNNVKAGRMAQGGSTITQQVAKSLLLSSERTFSRKIKDFLLAIEIEKKFSKEEILYLYLNQVYLGSGFYGINAAAKGYYGIELEKITTAQAALMAGLLSAPSRYSPYANPLFAKKRQLYVLEQLYNKNRITKDEYEKSKVEPIHLMKEIITPLKAPYFSEWVRQGMVDAVGDQAFLSEGYQITSTLDMDIQDTAEHAVVKGAMSVDKRQGYKGPLKSLLPDAILGYQIETMQAYLKESSSFLILSEHGILSSEKELAESQIGLIKSQLQSLEQSSSMVSVQWQSPLYPNPYYDPSTLGSLINENEYEAVVLKTNDKLKLIFISVGNLIGVIGYDNFKWAHKRKISEDTTWAHVTVEKPSSILKLGDVVKVKLLNPAPIALLSLVPVNVFSKTPADQPLKNQLSQMYFLSFSLEQTPEVQSSAVVMNSSNGEILALVGGVDFSKSKFNRATQSLRQAGSAVKPLIYAASLERGFTPASILLDTPQSLAGIDNISSWKPKNYDGEFKGLITMRTSLQESRNVSTINLLQSIGIDYTIDFMKRLKIRSQIPPNLSISLGSFGISLLDLTRSYGILSNGGKMISEKRLLAIKDRSGKSRPDLVTKLNQSLEEKAEQEKLAAAPSPTATPEQSPTPEPTKDTTKPEETKKSNAPLIDFTANLTSEQVYDSRLSFLMVNLMKGVISSGTAQEAKDMGPFYGGKTGTTSSYVDAWFIGFSKDYVTGTWIGFDNNTTLGNGETGATAALPMWKEIMQKVSAKYPPLDFSPPSGVVSYNISSKTGKVLKGITSDSIREYFVSGTQPGGALDASSQPSQSGMTVDEDDYWNQQ